MMRFHLSRKFARSVLLLFFLAVLLLPQSFTIPVEGAGPGSWNPGTFWYFPWGKSVTHKGVDIFAREGTPVVSSVPGIVVYAGRFGSGGLTAAVMGPRWRIHYYAHLQSVSIHPGSFVKTGRRIGTVGSTGNAQGKPPHLHYSIITLIPYPWRIDKAPQGWKKMFFLNPLDYLPQRR